MSVIAWDGTTLAADRQSTSGTLIRTTTKIWRVGNYLVAGVGGCMHIQALRDWVMGGFEAEKFPQVCQGETLEASISVFSPGQPVTRFENGPYPIVYTDKLYADGAGRDVALGAMAMGADAVKAVEIACLFNTECGGGVDMLTFDTAN